MAADGILSKIIGVFNLPFPRPLRERVGVRGTILRTSVENSSRENTVTKQLKATSITTGISLIYFYESKQQIIFTHGFVKKEQKTPKGEIEKAMSIRKALRGEK